MGRGAQDVGAHRQPLPRLHPPGGQLCRTASCLWVLASSCKLWGRLAAAPATLPSRRAGLGPVGGALARLRGGSSLLHAACQPVSSIPICKMKPCHCVCPPASSPGATVLVTNWTPPAGHTAVVNIALSLHLTSPAGPELHPRLAARPAGHAVPLGGGLQVRDDAGPMVNG